MRGKFLIGFILVLLGILVLLNSFGVTDVNAWKTIFDNFWPAVLTLVGLILLANMRFFSLTRIIVGVVCVAVGAGTIATHEGWLHLPQHFAANLFWPAVLIIVGIQMLLSARGDGRSWAILSGITRNHSGWKLKSTDYWVLLGGIHLDLRKAVIPDGVVNIEILTVMGGIDIIVPEGLPVECNGTAILGGMHLFGRDYGGLLTTHAAEHNVVGNSLPAVRIHCTSVLGGAKVIAR